MELNKYTWGALSLAFALLIFIPACKKGESSGNNTPIENLKGTRIVLSEEYKGGIPLFIREGHLMSKGAEDDYIYTWSAVRNDSIIPENNILRTGNGPDEVFTSHSGITYSGKGRMLAVSQKNGSMFSVDEFIKEGDHFDIVNLSNKDDRMQDINWYFRSFILENDSTILAIMAPYDNPDHFFARYDFKNNEYHKINWFFDDENNKEPSAKFSAYASNSSLLTNNKGKYLYVSGNERNAFIFTINGDKVNIESKIYETPLKYKLAPDGLNYACHHTGYDLTATVDDNHIYLLSIDKDGTGIHNESPLKNLYGNKLEVFDWNGNLERTLMLDHLGYSIMVNPADSSFYQFGIDSETGDYTVWKYKL